MASSPTPQPPGAAPAGTPLPTPTPTPPPFELERAPGRPDLVVDDNGVTFLIVAAGGVSSKTLLRLKLELDTGRQVSVVATPTAAAWLDHYHVGPIIEAMTGWPVRSQMPFPTTPTFDPPGSRVVVSPCTLNTLTKWWAAHSDNLALSLLCEAVGRGVPTVAEVSLSSAYASLPAVTEALTGLKGLGVDLYQAFGGHEHDLLQPLPSRVAAGLSAAAIQA